MSFFLLFSCIGAVAQDSWKWLNPIPNGQTGRDIFFLDGQTGFLLQDDLFQTRDGGVTWNPVASISGTQIVFRGNIGAVASGSGIYLSSDRGESWRKVAESYGDNFKHVQLIDDQIIYAIGWDGFYKSPDGGAHWTVREIDVPHVGDLYVTNFFFTSAAAGHATFSDGKIAKTIDGGNSWHVTEEEGAGGGFLFFLNEQVGFSQGQWNGLFGTTDGGETWHEILTTEGSLHTIEFVDEQVGYIGGAGGTLYKTVDGGASWTLMTGYSELPNHGGIYSFFFFNKTSGFAVGSYGQITETSDGGATWKQHGLTYADINDVYFYNDTIGYFFSDKVYKTTNRGITWTPLETGLSSKYRYISGYFLSENIGFVTARTGLTGSDAILLRTTDGGTHWTSTGVEAISVSFVSPTVGYAGGWDTYKTVDSGISWKRVGPASGQIHFMTELEGVCIDYYGDFYQTHDGGVTWIDGGFWGSFSDISFVDARTGYLCGQNGIVVKTTNGGGTWESVDTPTGQLTSISFMNAKVGIVIGYSSGTYYTSDGGRTWTKMYIPGNALYGALTQEGVIYGVGVGGAVVSGSLVWEDTKVTAVGIKSVTSIDAVVQGIAAANRDDITNVRLEYGEAGYVPDRRIDLLPATVAKGEKEQYEVTLSGLKPNTAYGFRLRARISGGIEIFSQVAYFSTEPGVGPVTGLDEGIREMVRLYPNPATSDITIEHASVIEQIAVSDPMGRQIFQAAPDTKFYFLQVGSYPPGIYILRMHSSGETIVRKIVKE